MTELQEKMLHLQTVSTIMNSEQTLRNIARQEALKDPNLDAEAVFMFYQTLLNNMKEKLIKELLHGNNGFYTSLNDTAFNIDSTPSRSN